LQFESSSLQRSVHSMSGVRPNTGVGVGGVVINIGVEDVEQGVDVDGAAVVSGLGVSSGHPLCSNSRGPLQGLTEQQPDHPSPQTCHA